MLAFERLRDGAAPQGQPFWQGVSQIFRRFRCFLGGYLQPACRGKGALRSRREGGGTTDHSFWQDEYQPEGRETT